MDPGSATELEEGSVTEDIASHPPELFPVRPTLTRGTHSVLTRCALRWEKS